MWGLAENYNQATGKNITDEEWATELRTGLNTVCKRDISILPNPTSSSATINIEIFRDRTFGFKYKLIFDQKIIYENDNSASNGKEVIPAHLLQNNGNYVVAYELYYSGSDRTFCTGTVNFMVTRQQ